MSALRRFLQNIYGFSRTETNGFLVLLPIMLLIIFSEPIYAWWISNRKDDFSAEKATLDSLSRQWELQKTVLNPNTHERKTALKFFYFNPNSATASQLNALGISPALTTRIIHYREKGGEFRIKADVLKIYGMDHELYQKLHPFIQLPDKIEKPVPENKFTTKSTLTKEILRFDLNEADTSELKSIYGIGTKLSERIVKYRESLGGFIRTEQLNEVYGLDSAVINRLLKRSFILDGFKPRMININTASEKELDSHPYITKSIASAIAAYRFQHGSFKDVNDLRELRLMKDDIAEKINPYLKIE